jgi:hypothetical protein
MKNKYNIAARAALFVLGLTAAFALNTTAIAQAPPGSLWYNGDFDGRNGGANQDGGQLGAGEYSHLYDNFNGPTSGTWTVTGLFSNNIMDAGLLGTITSASWDIRTGVSEGNGGTDIASGTSAATVIATGRSGFNRIEYQVMVTGLSISLPTLSSGFYFLNVSPIVPAGVVGQSFVTTTSGLNAVGTPPGNDGNSWWNSNLFAVNFTSSTAIFGAGTWDVSEGVIGTVPEPATWALLTCGVGALLIAARRRRGA